MDSRLRGHDGRRRNLPYLYAINAIPAQPIFSDGINRDGIGFSCGIGKIGFFL
ncbi:hypothetical protein [Neisseria sp.]|uniref:hypothetical protein n=1 Tax=Neisseria sp. TaxID=192066 RepID=UPI00359F18B4